MKHKCEGRPARPKEERPGWPACNAQEGAQAAASYCHHCDMGGAGAPYLDRVGGSFYLQCARCRGRSHSFASRFEVHVEAMPTHCKVLMLSAQCLRRALTEPSAISSKIEICGRGSHGIRLCWSLRRHCIRVLYLTDHSDAAYTFLLVYLLIMIRPGLECLADAHLEVFTSD
jgi:hypothetical protein